MRTRKRITQNSSYVYWLIPTLSFTLLGVACADPQHDQRSRGGISALGDDEDVSCPAEIQHQGLPPGTEAIHHDIDYWIDTWASHFDLDEVLLSPLEVGAHNRALLEGEGQSEGPEIRGQIDLSAPLDQEKFTAQVRGRLTFVTDLMREGKYVRWDGQPLSEEEIDALLELPSLTPAEVRIALRPFQILCAPYPDPIKRLDWDHAIDRNACTRVKPQAPIQLIGPRVNGLRLVRTRLAIGWIKEEEGMLSPPLTEEQRRDYLSSAFYYQPEKDLAERYERYQAELGSRGGALDPLGGVRFPLAHQAPPPDLQRQVADQETSGDVPDAEKTREPQVWLATPKGVEALSPLELGLIDESLTSEAPLTRRALLKGLFSQLGQSYGLGGGGDGVDCSRLIVNVLERFGLSTPRFSGHQANMGTFSVDLSAVKESREKLNLIEEASAQGVTLLFLPGHIAFYLGRDQEGIPRIFHAFADYQQVCEGGSGESKVRVNRVAVTDLDRGQGSSKGSYLERITRVIVLGGDPSSGLGLKAQGGLAEFRPAAQIVKPSRADCRRTKNRARIFSSPNEPHKGQKTRLMITRPRYDSPASLKLFGPNDQVLVPQLTRLGGPPYTYYSAPLELSEGTWRAAYGEGEDLHACTHIKVHPRPQTTQISKSFWDPQEEWSPHTETLYAAFIERLFQYPLDEDRSWTNLQDLLNVQEMNLLFDHLSSGEEARLQLQPDCADLPYTLRAYFAWKMRLPFQYMTCTRGSRKKAPRCVERFDSTLPRGEKVGQAVGDEFQWFARRGIAGHVHSASARTLPDDSETELYPIKLTRESLRPGIVFADPYGHLLLIAGWSTQPLNGYGVLIGADGQPDGTIGRRRFWEGSFLFDPDKRLVGAGFKAFRPLIRDQAEQGDRKRKSKKAEALPPVWRPVSNEELQDLRWGALKWSEQQYQGTKQSFYDRMGELTSPRPIEVSAQLEALADALFESARRRVLSVDNGENWVKTNPKRTMKMPSGYSIFETAGPWEDFATPSRDMRLLIAIDTVLDLPSAVRRTPQRFGVRADQVEETVKEVERTLEAALRSRSFEYTKTNGAQQALTLWDLTQRLPAFEMAYNPNDCVEARWGAPEGSAERQSCTRSAPRDQHGRMGRYRSWFHERKRPPRGTR